MTMSYKILRLNLRSGFQNSVLKNSVLKKKISKNRIKTDLGRGHVYKKV